MCACRREAEEAQAQRLGTVGVLTRCLAEAREQALLEGAAEGAGGGGGEAAAAPPPGAMLPALGHLPPREREAMLLALLGLLGAGRAG